MTDYLILIVYLLGYIPVYRKTYLVMANHDPSRGRDRVVSAEDRVFYCFIGLMVSIIWPLALAGYLFYRFLTPVSAVERKADLDAREREIQRMERELNIKHDDY